MIVSSREIEPNSRALPLRSLLPRGHRAHISILIPLHVPYAAFFLPRTRLLGVAFDPLGCCSACVATGIFVSGMGIR